MKEEQFMEIGVTDKLVIDGNWQSFLRIGNQTFYFTTTETKEEAEWFATQLKVGIDLLLQAERKRKSKWKNDRRESHYKYIYFVGDLNSDKAGVWLCKNIKSKETLGKVDYHEKWKEWIFEGMEFSFYNYSCLLDISDFLQKLNSVKNLTMLAKAVTRHLQSHKRGLDEKRSK